jgi:hypothetical protein
MDQKKLGVGNLKAMPSSLRCCGLNPLRMMLKTISCAALFCLVWHVYAFKLIFRDTWSVF